MNRWPSTDQLNVCGIPSEHHSYQGISDVIQRLDRYTELGRPRPTGPRSAVRCTALVMRPLGRFLRNYVLKQGFRDGIPGLINAVSYAYSVFVREAKPGRWQRSRIR